MLAPPPLLLRCFRGPAFPKTLTRPAFFPSLSRAFHPSASTMSDIAVQLTAPNGRKYSQPIGLFINNEFVPSKSGEKFASINPS